MLGWLPATYRFLEFFRFFRFFPLKLIYFWTKSRKKIYGCFFHSICATDLNFGAKINGRTKLSTLKTLIFANCWGPEVVRIKKIFSLSLLIYIYLDCVRRASWSATTLDTLMYVQGSIPIASMAPNDYFVNSIARGCLAERLCRSKLGILWWN